MDAQQKIAESKIAIEDLIKGLEAVIDQAGKSLVPMKGQAINAVSPELFRHQLAVARTRTQAKLMKAELLRVAGMRPDTCLSPHLVC